jgi:hypothetical protein
VCLRLLLTALGGSSTVIATWTTDDFAVFVLLLSGLLMGIAIYYRS